MKYKAYFSYDAFDGNGDHLMGGELIPIAKIMVDGGTKRLVSLRTTDDISLVSELEQARTFKNIILYLSSTKDGKDMKAAVDLTEIAVNKYAVSVGVLIERFSGGKRLEGLLLYDTEAALKYRPANALENTLMIHFELSNPTISQGKIENHYMIGPSSKEI